MLLLLTRLSAGPGPVGPGLRFLSRAERARAGRLPAQRRAQYLAGRVLLRDACARLGGGPASAWRLNPEGLPLAQRTGRPAPWLSLAHSGEWLAATASWGPGVGVDLERRGQRRDWRGLHRLVRRWELASEGCAWPAGPPAEAFLGDWTRYEAAYKAAQSFAAAARRPQPVQAWTLQGKDLVLSVCGPERTAPAWVWVGSGSLKEWVRCPQPWTLDVSKL